MRRLIAAVAVTTLLIGTLAPAAHAGGPNDAARALVGAVEDVLDQGRLPRAGDSGHGDEGAQRQLDVDVLEVVCSGAADAQEMPSAPLLAASFLPVLPPVPVAVAASLGGRALAQVAAGERFGGGEDGLDRPFRHHLSAIDSNRLAADERLRAL